MKYLIGFILFIAIYLVDFAKFALIFVLYTAWHFKFPNPQNLWGLYHAHCENNKYGRRIVNSSFKYTWNYRISTYLKHGQG